MFTLTLVTSIYVALSATQETFTLLEDEIMLDDSVPVEEILFPIPTNSECNLKIFQENKEPTPFENIKLTIADYFVDPNFDGFSNNRIDCDRFTETLPIKLECYGTNLQTPCMGNHFIYTIYLYCSDGSTNNQDTYIRETTTVKETCDGSGGIVHVKHLPDTKCNIHVHNNGVCPITTKWFIVPTGQAATTDKHSGDFREVDQVKGSRSYFWECLGIHGSCEAFIDIYCLVIPGKEMKNDLDDDKFATFEGGCKDTAYEKIFDEEIDTFCPTSDSQKGIIRKLVNLPPVPCDIYVNDRGSCPITTKWYVQNKFGGLEDFSGKQEGDMRVVDKIPEKDEVILYGQRTYMWECNEVDSMGDCQADIDIYCAT